MFGYVFGLQKAGNFVKEGNPNTLLGYFGYLSVIRLVLLYRFGKIV